MADARFQSRLAALEANAQALFNAQRAAHDLPKSRNRKEKLAIALAHLERGGVTGIYAYAPLFARCASFGVILKPLHYRSLGGLVAFFMSLALVMAVFILGVVAVTGTMPRPVRGMIDAGPLVFFSGAFLFSMVCAGFHKLKARKLRLPQWRDI